MPQPIVVRHFPLAAVLWPDRADGFSAVARAVTLIALGTALLTLSAKINLPLPYLCADDAADAGRADDRRRLWLAPRHRDGHCLSGGRGYRIAGVRGSVGGLAPLMGPTAGYLAGFVAAAFMTGWLSERGWDRSVPRLFVAMGLGHVVILVSGFAWLAFGMKLGVEKAWLVGIAPFVAASVIKNALGAALVPAIRHMLERRG